MAALPRRLKVLRTIDNQPHRYRRLRRFTMSLTVLVLWIAPMLGASRFDLWAGHHLFWRKHVEWPSAFVGLAMSVVAFYVVTFLLNIALGRVFCGWGCPVGEVSRLGDAVELARKTKKQRLGAEARAIGYAALLGGAGFFWLCDWHVFTQGTPTARVLAGLGAIAGIGIVYAHGLYWRWSFCETWCPIGAYYTAIQFAHRFGVHYDEAKGTCTDCGLCHDACPVELDPRNLGRIKVAKGGIALDDYAEQNHCLVCGDCVRACEAGFRVKGLELVPLHLTRNVPPSEAKPPKPAKEGGELHSLPPPSDEKEEGAGRDDRAA